MGLTYNQIITYKDLDYLWSECGADEVVEIDKAVTLGELQNYTSYFTAYNTDDYSDDRALRADNIKIVYGNYNITCNRELFDNKLLVYGNSGAGTVNFDCRMYPYNSGGVIANLDATYSSTQTQFTGTHNTMVTPNYFKVTITMPAFTYRSPTFTGITWTFNIELLIDGVSVDCNPVVISRTSTVSNNQITFESATGSVEKTFMSLKFPSTASQVTSENNEHNIIVNISPSYTLITSTT